MMEKDDANTAQPGPGGPVVPETIVAKLRSLISRSRRVLALRGACATVAVAMASVLVVMAVDAGVTIFQDWARWALSAAALAATLLAAVLFLVRPLVRSYTMTGVARLIETRHPEMHERLSSALQLLTSKDRPELRGSDALIAALADEAALHADALQVHREVTLRSARPFAYALAVSGTLLAILLLAWPGTTGQLLVRALAPGANLPNIHAGDLVIHPGDAVIAQGQRLEVAVLVKDARVQSARLVLTPEQGKPETTEMKAAGSENGCPRLAITCPPADGSFRYRVQAGDALSSYYRVTVVPPPVLKQVALTYDYPPYTRLPTRTENAAGDIKVVAGTKVRMAIRSNKPLASARATIVQGQGKVQQVIEAALSPDRTEATLTIDVTPDLSGRYTLQLTDTMGFQAPPVSRNIQSLRDESPSVRFVSPQESSMRLGREDRLPLVYNVGDDFGLSTCQLLLKTENGMLDTITLPPPPGKPRRAWEAPYLLDLSALRLADAKTLSIQVRAVDNLPNGMRGPQQGLSDSISISLDRAAPSYMMQVEMAHELRIRAVLEEVLKHLTAAKQESGPIKVAKDRMVAHVSKTLHRDPAKPDDATWTHLTDSDLKHVETMRKRLSDAEKPLRDVIQQIAGGNFQPLAIKLTELTDDHVAKAGSLIAGLRSADTLAEQANIANDADYQVDRALAVVSDMLRNLSVMTELARRSQALADMAQKQQALAAEKAALEMAMKATSMPATGTATAPAPGAVTPAMAEAQKRWQEKQAKLASEMNDLVKQTKGALGMRAMEENKTTRNLAADARELALEQAALSQETSQAIGREQVQAALRDLAGKQVELAKETARDAVLAEPAKTMTDLSPEMASASAAVEAKLAAADAQLQAQAALNQQLKAAVALLGQAQQMAARQQQIAQEIAAAAKIAQEQQTAAQASRDQLVQNKSQQAAARETIKNTLAELAKSQRDLAARATQTEGKLPGNPATASVGAKPSGAMNSTAQNLSQGSLLPSKAAAQQASAQAQDLSQKLAAALAEAQKKAADASAMDAAARELAAAQGNLQTLQVAAVAAQSSAVTQAGAAAQADQTARKAEGASGAAAAAVTPAQKEYDQKAAQANAAAQLALKSEADAKSARAAADAAKSAKAPDAAQKETAAQAAAVKAAQDRAAATAAQGAVAPALATLNNLKAAAQAAAAVAAKERATATTAKQASDAAAAAANAAQAKIKPAQDAIAAATQKQQVAAAQKDQAAKNAAAADAASKEAAAVAQEQAALSQKVEQLLAGAGKQLADLETAAIKTQQEQAAHEQAQAAAANRIAAQANPQRELAQQAQRIAQGLAQATAQARAAVGAIAPAAAMTDAANLATQPGKHLQADQAAQKAQAQIQQLAQALTTGVGPNPPTAAQSDQLAARISSLVQRQTQMHNQARTLLGQNTNLGQAQRQSIVSRLRTEQDQLTRRVQEVTDQVKALVPQADRLDVTAARQVMQASQEIAASKLTEAAATAELSSKSLVELAKRLGASAEDLVEPLPASRPAGGPATDKSSSVVVKGTLQVEPDQVRATQAIARTRKKELLAANAAMLARRQQQVAREMQALTQEQVGTVLLGRQYNIAKRTEDLANDVDLLQEHSVELIPQSQIRALTEQATKEMSHALAQQQAAAKSIQAQALAAALPNEHESAAALNRAASALEQLGQQLAQAAAKDAAPADKQEQEETGYLARAAEQADIASRTEEAKDALRAAKLLMELSNLATNRAQMAGVTPLDLMQLMNSDMRSGTFPGMGSRGVMAVELTPEQLEALGISTSDWARLPGQLKDEVLQAASDSAPAEYRELIKRYFQEVARRGQKDRK